MSTTISASASAKENVLIQAGDCSLSVLPEYGAKIGSLRFRNHELLQAPLSPISTRTPAMPFEAGDASGWDECLPSVSACEVQIQSEVHFPGRPQSVPAAIPDHGDLWRVAWTVQNHTPNSVTLSASCFSLPLALTRKLTLTETEAGVRLILDYRLTNTGSVPVPWSWAAHPLFTAGLDDRIVLPDSVHTLRLEGSAGNRLGSRGDEILWPIAQLADGSHTDLSSIANPNSGFADKLFAGPMSADHAWCSLDRPSAGVRIKVSFNPDATPYLGLWICCGGWPEGSGPKQICVALEPATAPVDSLADSGPWSRTLAPAECFNWPLQVDLETL